MMWSIRFHRRNAHNILLSNVFVPRLFFTPSPDSFRRPLGSRRVLWSEEPPNIKWSLIINWVDLNWKGWSAPLSNSPHGFAMRRNTWPEVNVMILQWRNSSMRAKGEGFSGLAPRESCSGFGNVTTCHSLCPDISDTVSGFNHSKSLRFPSNVLNPYWR
jgi:hypothetical protein